MANKQEKRDDKQKIINLLKQKPLKAKYTQYNIYSKGGNEMECCDGKPGA